MDRYHVLAARAWAHGLAARRPVSALVEVVGACAVADTPPGNGGLALDARLDGLTPEGLATAFADGVLAETWSLRGGPQLFPAADLAVFTLGVSSDDERTLRDRCAGVAPALVQAGLSLAGARDRVVDAMVDALGDGPLPKSELSRRTTAALPDVLTPFCRPCGVAHVSESMFRLAGLSGRIVFDGQESPPVLALAAEPAGGDPGAARRELVRRFLRCYGPATAAELAAWAALSKRDAAAALADQPLVAVDGGSLHEDDVAAYEASGDVEGVRLLPAGDPYLHQKDRSVLAPDPSVQKRVWRVIGNPGVVLADGRLAATWRARKKGRRLDLTVEPVEWSAADLPRVEVEAARLAPWRGVDEVAVVVS